MPCRNIDESVSANNDDEFDSVQTELLGDAEP